MKKLFTTLAVVAALMLAVSAHALDMDAAATMHAETGIDGLCLNTPDGSVPDYFTQGWNAIDPFYVYSDSGAEAMIVADNYGSTYTFYVAANQRSIAPCVANGLDLYLFIEGSYISATGCKAP